MRPTGHLLRIVLLGLVAGTPACAWRAGRTATAATDLSASEVAPTRAVMDFAGVDAWLACAATAASPERCESASESTPGGRIASLASATFGGEGPAVTVPSRQAVDALVVRMKAWPDAVARVQRLLPERVGGGPVHVFVVANGHAWGDAYVRRVADVVGPAMTLSESGEPVIMLNALLIAGGYGPEASVQAAAAFGVLSHELFHALFQRYRSAAPLWQGRSGALGPLEALQLIVLDEGIAHFVDRGPTLLAEGLPTDRAGAAVAALARAWERLSELPATSPEAWEMVQTSNQGRFWDKYGSIAGLVFAFGVHRAYGPAALQDAARCGPGRLKTLYVSAAERASDLPRLPRALERSFWVDLCGEAPARP